MHEVIFHKGTMMMNHFHFRTLESHLLHMQAYTISHIMPLSPLPITFYL